MLIEVLVVDKTSWEVNQENGEIENYPYIKCLPLLIVSLRQRWLQFRINRRAGFRWTSRLDPYCPPVRIEQETLFNVQFNLYLSIWLPRKYFKLIFFLWRREKLQAKNETRVIKLMCYCRFLVFEALNKWNLCFISLCTNHSSVTKQIKRKVSWSSTAYANGSKISSSPQWWKQVDIYQNQKKRKQRTYRQIRWRSIKIFKTYLSLLSQGLERYRESYRLIRLKVAYSFQNNRFLDSAFIAERESDAISSWVHVW